MKRLFFLMLLISNIGHAQNYKCLQSGVRHYFTNGNGYLRGIRIDSVRTLGDSTVYYPFRTPRGGEPTTLPPDSIGGSWLGKRVIQKPDGTFIFDSFWGDSVIIRSQAHTGDSWVMYHDTSSLFYTASVTSIDTMSFLSVADSVKTIVVNAMRGTTTVTTDPLNGITILLSKDYGFVQVCDLYTFPYHLPGATYTPFIDYYMDASLATPNNGHPPPSVTNVVFSLVNFINPNQQQLYNWHIGDIVESYHSYNWGVPLTSIPAGTYNSIADTVTSKTTSGSATTYTLSGIHYACSAPADPCTVLYNNGSYTFDSSVYPLADTFLMPEEVHTNTGYTLYYFPTDSSGCMATPKYISVNYNETFEDYTEYTVYKLGMGAAYYNLTDVDDLTWIQDGLLYTNFNGVGCGTPLGVQNVIKPVTNIALYPDPAHNELTIQADGADISDLRVTDLLGQTVHHSTYAGNNKLQVLDVRTLAPGIYLLSINNMELRRFVKE
jgi:Secretion system C-terminal sorting domain